MGWARKPHLSSRALPRTLAALLVLFALAGCGSEDGASPQPVDEPPWGLDTVELPSDDASVTAVFAAMPESIDGVPRDEGSTTTDNVEYSDGGDRYLMVRAISTEDLATFSGGEVSTVQEYFAMAVESAEYDELEASQVDETQPLLYVAASAIADDQTNHVIIWGVPDGDWVFTAAADTAEARTELIGAFITACNAES